MSETRFRLAKSGDTVGFERDPRASGASTNNRALMGVHRSVFARLVSEPPSGEH